MWSNVREGYLRDRVSPGGRSSTTVNFNFRIATMSHGENPRKISPQF